jgi:nucleoside-diphosphate-sugar epimerase
VTGGAGFIGSHLVRRLLAEGCSVLVLDDLSSGLRKNVSTDAELVVGDVRDIELVNEVMERCDRAFHLAAFVNLPDSFAQCDECMSINVDGTRCVFEAALNSGVGKVVFSSTSALYPDAPAGPKREGGPLATESPYAESKLLGEQLLWEYQERGLQGVALRYFNVFGPGQPADSDYAAVIPLFIARSLAGERLMICGDGRQTRDFVYVEDVAGVNWHAAQSAVNGVFNVGTSDAMAIIELANMTCQMLEQEPNYDFSELRPGDVLSSTACTERAQKILGWRAQWRFEDGLNETIKWWKSL